MDYLTFHVGEREFAVGLDRVREIVTPPPIARVPGMPPALLGLAGLRGNPTTVVDAGLRLAGRAVARSGRTPLIVLEVRDLDRAFEVGLLVEAAGRKLELDALLPWSAGLARFAGADACTGFADVDGRLVLVLDVDRLLAFERIAASAGTALPPPARVELPQPAPTPVASSPSPSPPQGGAFAPPAAPRPEPAVAATARHLSAHAPVPVAVPVRVAAAVVEPRRMRWEPVPAPADAVTARYEREPAPAPSAAPSAASPMRLEPERSHPFRWIAAGVAVAILAGLLFALGGSREPRAEVATPSTRLEPPPRAAPVAAPAAAPLPVVEAPVAVTIAPEPAAPRAPPAARTERALPPQLRVTPDTPLCEIHEVRKGESLWLISARALGNPNRWPEVFGQNRDRIVNPNLIEVDDRIRIPGACRPAGVK